LFRYRAGVDNMRIAFITPEYVTEHNFDGGLANYLYRVTGALKELGHDVEVFTSSNQTEETVFEDILVHRVNHQLLFIKKIPFLNRFNKTIDIILRSFALKRTFLKTHSNMPFDIIQAASYLSPTFLWESIDIPIVTRVSSFTPCWRTAYGNSCRLDDAICEWFEVLQMRKSCAVYAPSRLLSKIISQHEPLNIDVLRPPFHIVQEQDCALEEFQDILSDKEYLLFFGTIGRMKGTNFIWQNLSRIFAENKDIYFVFVGKGTLPAYYESLNLYRKRIIHFSSLRHSHLVPIIKGAKAVVLPSIIDNLPNTCLESMHFNKVVISTLESSCDELIEDDVSGFLFEQGDSEQFCTIVNRVCQMEQEQLALIGERAHERVHQMVQWDQQIDELIQYFQRVINSSLE